MNTPSAPAGAPADIEAALAAHELFRRFDPAERVYLARRVRRRAVLPGEAICREGAAAVEWYLLVEGIARVSRTRPDAGQEFIARVLPGAIFGVVGVLNGGGRPATVAALQPSVCLVFPRSLLDGEDGERVAGRLGLCLSELLCAALNQQLRALNQRLLGMAREVTGQAPSAPRGGFGGWIGPAEGA